MSLRDYVSRLSRLFVHEQRDPIAAWSPRAREPGLRSVMWRNEAYDRCADADQWAAIVRHLPQKRSSVLDLGCGTGRLTERLADRFDAYVGVDLEPMVEVARQRHPGLLGNGAVSFSAATAQTYEYGSDAHDLVLSMACLASACTADELRALASVLARCVRPGGRLVLIDPFHTTAALTRTCRATPSTVVSWFVAAGMRPIAREGLHFVPVRLAFAGAKASDRLTSAMYRFGERVRARVAPLRSADYHVLCFERPRQQGA